MKEISIGIVLSRIDRASAYLTLKSVFGSRFLSFERSDSLLVSDDFSASETSQAIDIIFKRNTLDSWELSKLRNLTLTQINNEIASLDAEIDAAQNLAAAKVVLKKILVDDAKAWRIILWLLKREMNEL